MDVHLGTGREEDAVLVDEVDLTVRLEAAVDLAWAQVPDPIEGSPRRIALLVEIDRGIRSYVEALPVDDRLGLRLVDDHLAGSRLADARPPHDTAR